MQFLQGVLHISTHFPANVNLYPFLHVKQTVALQVLQFAEHLAHPVIVVVILSAAVVRTVLKPAEHPEQMVTFLESHIEHPGMHFMHALSV